MPPLPSEKSEAAPSFTLPHAPHRQAESERAVRPSTAPHTRPAPRAASPSGSQAPSWATWARGVWNSLPEVLGPTPPALSATDQARVEAWRAMSAALLGTLSAEDRDSDINSYSPFTVYSDFNLQSQRDQVGVGLQHWQQPRMQQITAGFRSSIVNLLGLDMSSRKMIEGCCDCLVRHMTVSLKFCRQHNIDRS